ncbi:MAG TPA: sigma-70 family RNA polymerase sigma factor [Acidimicrobiia bacterium]|jgi:RNA polymerase sigma factor (sigma-70 family)|nr:sigma-70 family RNA polymerase sigma factor [Acidimicrobiia bacterium]
MERVEFEVHQPRAGTGDLVRAAAAGDAHAWNELVARYGGMVWTVARRHRLSAADAADVSQTTWLRLVEHLDRIQHPERVGGWLATTARREALRVVRQSRRQVSTDDDNVLDLTLFDEASPDVIVTTRSRDEELWRAFATLPVRCQLILQLLGGDEPLSYAELADVMEMPVGSIGPTRARCLEQLGRRVANRGISSA